MAQDNTLEGAAMTMETLQLIDDYETLKGKYDELKRKYAASRSDNDTLREQKAALHEQMAYMLRNPQPSAEQEQQMEALAERCEKAERLLALRDREVSELRAQLQQRTEAQQTVNIHSGGLYVNTLDKQFNGFKPELVS